MQQLDDDKGKKIKIAEDYIENLHSCNNFKRHRSLTFIPVFKNAHKYLGTKTHIYL